MLLVVILSTILFAPKIYYVYADEGGDIDPATGLSRSTKRQGPSKPTQKSGTSQDNPSNNSGNNSSDGGTSGKGPALRSPAPVVLHVLDHSWPVLSGYSVRSRNLITAQYRSGEAIKVVLEAKRQCLTPETNGAE